MEKHTHILKENLKLALEIAIEYRLSKEKDWGYEGESGLVKGWKENIESLRSGSVEIKY